MTILTDFLWPGPKRASAASRRPIWRSFTRGSCSRASRDDRRRRRRRPGNPGRRAGRAAAGIVGSTSAASPTLEPPSGPRGRGSAAARPAGRTAGGRACRPSRDRSPRPDLRSHPGPEPDPGRSIHLSAQCEAARGARLHLRRRSHFDCRRSAGPFSISTSVQSRSARRGARRHPPRVEGLDRRPASQSGRARQRPPRFIEGQARHFETPSALVNRFASLVIHGLPVDHEAGFADRLAGIELRFTDRRPPISRFIRIRWSRSSSPTPPRSSRT